MLQVLLTLPVNRCISFISFPTLILHATVIITDMKTTVLSYGCLTEQKGVFCQFSSYFSYSFSQGLPQATNAYPLSTQYSMDAIVTQLPSV